MSVWRTMLVALGVAALHAGCATNPRLVEAGDDAEVAAYEVDPQIEWSRQQARDLEIWTVNGVQLEQLRLYSDVESADSLFPQRQGASARAEPEERPRFRPDMRAHDVMELVQATLAQSGALDISVTQLRPANFGDRPGFRFDLALTAPSGLAYRGLAAGAVKDERLQLILFLAAEPHYYPRYAPVVRRIIKSVHFP